MNDHLLAQAKKCTELAAELITALAKSNAEVILLRRWTLDDFNDHGVDMNSLMVREALAHLDNLIDNNNALLRRAREAL